MLKLLWVIGFAAAIAIPTLANAQAPAEFNLKVTNDDVAIIGKGLGRLPFDDVAPLIQKLREQITSQNQPPAITGNVPVPPIPPKRNVPELKKE